MKKIIISVVSISLVLFVGISALVLSLIPTGINNTISKPDEIYIFSSKTKELSPTGLTLRSRDENEKDTLTNVYSIFCHAFEQNILSAIFNGELNKVTKENYVEKGSKTISKNSSSEEKMTVVFKYNKSQIIKDGSYTYLFFEITNDNMRSEIVFGVSSSCDTTNENFNYNYYYFGKANFSNLYSYILGVI